MNEQFVCVNALFEKIRNIFKCHLCSEVKNEDSIIFYWNCEHFYCLDCIEVDKPCVVCSAVNGKSVTGKQVKLTENENILAVFRSLANCKYPFTSVSNSEKKEKGSNKKSKREANSAVKEKSVISDTNKNDTQAEPQRKSSKKKANVAAKENSIVLDVSKADDQQGQKKSNKKALNVTKRNYKGETPLHLACRKFNLTLMQELIDAGANPNLQDNAGWTPLHDSIVFGNQEVIKFLLDNGARVNTPGHENTTALHQSVIEGNTAVTRLLLRYGADKNARNIFGETPLDLIKKYNINGMEEILLNTPAKFKSRSQAHQDSLILHSRTDPVLYGFMLDEDEAAALEKFASQFKYKTVDKLSPQLSATHIVASQTAEPKISWSIVPGVLMACQVISVQWLKESMDKNEVQPSEKYEVKGEFFAGFAKSRQNQLNQLPGLFSGCHFYFGGNFELYKTKNSSFLKTELKVLVEKNGGVVLTRNPDPESLALEKTIPYHADVSGSLAKTSYFIIYSKDLWDPAPKYNMPHMKTLPVEWLLASIFNFELIDPNRTQSYMDSV